MEKIFLVQKVINDEKTLIHNYFELFSRFLGENICVGWIWIMAISFVLKNGHICGSAGQELPLNVLEELGVLTHILSEH